MKNITFLLAATTVLMSCSTQKNAKKDIGPTSLEDAYYNALNGNQARLHQLMLGTFVAHAGKDGENLESWTVTDTDSVVLYSFAIGNVSKEGYWIYSYEFMTSLPNNPIYTAIKQIVQKDRDTFEVHYYTPPNSTKIRLIDILKKNALEDLDIKTLVKTPKITTYYRVNNTNFIGYSEVYEDKDCKCFRRNNYDISPTLYKVDAEFFSLKDKKPIQRKNRPNVMVRRLIDKRVLLKIAQKEYEVKD